jgi:hypothetical protein
MNFDEKGYARISKEHRLDKYGEEWTPIVPFRPLEDLTVSEVYSSTETKQLYSLLKAYETKASCDLAMGGYKRIVKQGFYDYVRNFDYPKLLEGKTALLTDYF